MVREKDVSDSEDTSSESESSLKLCANGGAAAQRIQNQREERWYYWKDFESENEEYSPFCHCKVDYRGEYDETYCPRCYKPVEISDDDTEWEDEVDVNDVKENQIKDDTTENVGEANEVDYDGDIEDNDD